MDHRLSDEEYREFQALKAAVTSAGSSQMSKTDGLLQELVSALKGKKTSWSDEAGLEAGVGVPSGSGAAAATERDPLLGRESGLGREGLAARLDRYGDRIRVLEDERAEAEVVHVLWAAVLGLGAVLISGLLLAVLLSGSWVGVLGTALALLVALTMIPVAGALLWKAFLRM